MQWHEHPFAPLYTLILSPGQFCALAKAYNMNKESIVKVDLMVFILNIFIG
jgi:hypothetical protein